MQFTNGLRSWGVLGALALAVVIRAACTPAVGPGTDPEVVVALEQVLADAWPEVIAPALARSRADAEALAEATDAWAAAPNDPQALEAAREAWRAAMTSWQAVEVMQIGPLGSALVAAGGQDLRDRVYSWPTISPCRVDQETVDDDWSEAGFVDESLVNVLGLDALETLLFSPDGENSCDELASINLNGTWDALGADEIRARRAGYARVLAGAVAEAQAQAEDAWAPGGGDFAGKLAAAGDGAPFESPEQGLNAIFDALFYLETRTKDDKLGAPLGLIACPSDCLAFVETQAAGGSQLWIAANLRGFRALFTGGGGGGMEDLLRSLGEDQLADDVLSALDAADLAAAALTVPVDRAVATGDPAGPALYQAIKAVTDLLKGDVATVLTLQIPAEAAGDND